MKRIYQSLKCMTIAILFFGMPITSSAHSNESDSKTDSEWTHDAIALERSKDWSGLAKYAISWTEARPTDQYAWLALYVSHERQGDVNGAISSVSKSLELSPELIDFWMSTSNVSLEKQQNSDVILISNGILKAREFAPALKNLGYAQMRTGQYIEAATSLNKYISHDKNDKLSFLYLGLIYENSGQYESAIAYFKQALKIDPAYVSALNRLAYTYHKLDKNNDRAMEVYAKLEEIDEEQASNLAHIIGIGSISSSSLTTGYGGLTESLDQATPSLRNRTNAHQSICSCKGYSGPGGPCYNGPGGAAYDGPGGPAYRGAGGACYAGPGGAEYDGPGGAAYDGPGGPRYNGPGGRAYDGPGGPAYSGPGGACYAGPGGPCYSGPGGSGKRCPAVCK